MINENTKSILKSLLDTLPENAQQKVYFAILDEVHCQAENEPVPVIHPKLYDLELRRVHRYEPLDENGKANYHKINAIKAIRAANPFFGLKEAKDLVDTFVAYLAGDLNPCFPILLRGHTLPRVYEAYTRFVQNSSGYAEARIVENKD